MLNLLIQALCFPDSLSLTERKEMAGGLIEKMNQPRQREPEVLLIRAALFPELVSQDDLRTMVRELIARLEPASRESLDVLIIRVLLLEETLPKSSLQALIDNLLSEAQTPSVADGQGVLKSDKTKETKEVQESDCVEETVLIPEQGVTASPIRKKRGRPKKEEAQGQNVTASPTRKKGGRPKKGEKAPEQEKAVSSVQKKRGRPKRKENTPKAVADSSETSDDEMENVEPEDAALVAIERGCLLDEIGETSQQKKQEKKTFSSRGKALENAFFAELSDYPDLETMGREQKYRFVYKMADGRYLLSCFVVNGLNPIGIFIKYSSKMFGRYDGFIVDVYNENVFSHPSEAMADLAEKGKQINGSPWLVMNSVQYAMIKNAKDELNMMLKKVGGDCFLSSYWRISPMSNVAAAGDVHLNPNSISGGGSIRYTLDISLTKAE